MSILSKIYSYFWFLVLFLRIKLNKTVVENNKVLLVHFAHIGDFIIFLDSAKEYKNLYPNKKIILLCRKFKSVYEIAKLSECFDEIILLDDSWKERAKSIKKMKSYSFETIINTRATRDIQSDLYVMASKSNQRFAPETDNTMMGQKLVKISDLIYTKIIKCSGIEEMELIRNAEFLRGLGHSNFKASIPYLNVNNDILVNGIEENLKYFVVCAGANNRSNIWSYERFVYIIDKVFENSDLNCILLGVESENSISNNIIEKSKYSKRIINLVGKTDLLSYIEVIRNAEFFLGNDSSGGHIGAATKTKTFVIQPEWNYGRFFPYKTETKQDEENMPISISADLKCRGCGKDPTTNGNKNCIKNSVMHCVDEVSLEKVESLVIPWVVKNIK